MEQSGDKGIEGIARRDFVKKVLAVAGTTALTRVLAAGETAVLSACAALEPKPHVIPLMWSGRYRGPQDFWTMHERNQTYGSSARFDPPGLNMAYRHKEKVFAPVKSRIHFAKFFNDTGNQILLDSGVFLVTYSHLDSINKEFKRGDIVDRNSNLGTQGSTGTNAQNESHLALRLYGNAMLKNDINYFTGWVKDRETSNLNYQGKRPFNTSCLNDPDRFTPNGKPLIESTWDGTDLDTKYLDAVEIVKEDIDRLIRDHPGSRIARRAEIGRDEVFTEPDGEYKRHLVNRLSNLWVFVQDYIKEGKIDFGKKSWYIRPWEFTPDDSNQQILRYSFRVAQDANKAASLFKLTSPYRV